MALLIINFLIINFPENLTNCQILLYTDFEAISLPLAGRNAIKIAFRQESQGATQGIFGFYPAIGRVFLMNLRPL